MPVSTIVITLLLSRNTGSYLTVIEGYREEWKKLVVTFTVVRQRSARLRDL